MPVATCNAENTADMLLKIRLRRENTLVRLCRTTLWKIRKILVFEIFRPVRSGMATLQSLAPFQQLFHPNVGISLHVLRQLPIFAASIRNRTVSRLATEPIQQPRGTSAGLDRHPEHKTSYCNENSTLQPPDPRCHDSSQRTGPLIHRRLELPGVRQRQARQQEHPSDCRHLPVVQ